jgi:hypothetical protein
MAIEHSRAPSATVAPLSSSEAYNAAIESAEREIVRTNTEAAVLSTTVLSAGTPYTALLLLLLLLLLASSSVLVLLVEEESTQSHTVKVALDSVSDSAHD